MEHAQPCPGWDGYTKRIEAVLIEISRPDYPAGLISWLEHAAPELYVELTEQLPGEVHRLCSTGAPFGQFEEVLASFVRAHSHACELYRHHLSTDGGIYGHFSESATKQEA